MDPVSCQNGALLFSGLTGFLGFVCLILMSFLGIPDKLWEVEVCVFFKIYIAIRLFCPTFPVMLIQQSLSLHLSPHLHRFTVHGFTHSQISPQKHQGGHNRIFAASLQTFTVRHGHSDVLKTRMMYTCIKQYKI